MNFVTPEGLNYFADMLAQIDQTTYKDVITALKTDDREDLMKSLAPLDQKK